MGRSIQCTVGISSSRSRSRRIWVLILVILFTSTDAIHDRIITRGELVVGRIMACIRNWMNTAPAGNRGLGNLLGSGGKMVCVVAVVPRHREGCYFHGPGAVLKIG